MADVIGPNGPVPLDAAAYEFADLNTRLTAALTVASPERPFTIREALNAARKPVGVVVPSLPTITLSTSQSKPEGNSGPTLFTATVTRSAAGVSLVVPFSIALGSMDGSDFTGGVAPTGGTLTIAAGALSASADFSVNGDTTVEPDEAFTISISPPSGYSAGARMSATYGVLNDDVAAPAGPTLLVVGDSFVAGSKTTAGNSIPEQLFARETAVARTWAAKTRVGLSSAQVVSGTASLNLTGLAPTEVDPTLASAGAGSVLILIAGTNDIRVSSRTAENLFNDVKAYVQARKAVLPSLKVIVTTLVYRKISDSSGIATDAAFRARATDYNNLLRERYTEFADGLADVVLDSRLYSNTNTTYFDADGVHPADAGAGAYSEVLQIALSTVLNGQIPATERLDIWGNMDIDSDNPKFSTSGSYTSGMNETDDETGWFLTLGAQDSVNIVGIVCGAQDGNIAGAQQTYGAYENDLANLRTYAADPSVFKTRAQLEAITYQSSRETTGGDTKTPAKGYRESGDAEYAQANDCALKFIAAVQAGIAAGRYDATANPRKKLYYLEQGAPTDRAQITFQAVQQGAMADIWKYVRILKPSAQNDTRDANARRYLMGYGNDDATAGMIGYGPSGIKGPAGDTYVIQWGMAGPSRQETACGDLSTTGTAIDNVSVGGKAFYTNNVRQHGAAGAMVETFGYVNDSKTNQSEYYRAADAVAIWWLLRAIKANNFDPTASLIGGPSRLYNGEAWVDSAAQANIAVTKTGWLTGFADTPVALNKADFQLLVSEIFDRYLQPRPAQPLYESLERSQLPAGNVAVRAPTMFLRQPFGIYSAALAEGVTINAYKPAWAGGVFDGTYPQAKSFQWVHRTTGGDIAIGAPTSVFTALTVPTFADGISHEIALLVTASNAAGSSTQRISIGSFMASSTGTPDTTPPVIGNVMAYSQPENSAWQLTLTANEAVTWSLIGGADQARFVLTGDVLSMAAKDFEAPTDSDANNTYNAIVRATDTAGNISDLSITVTITDVAEGGGGVPPGEDADATAWVQGIAANGGTAPSTTQRTAMDSFVKGFKAGGYTKHDVVVASALYDAIGARWDIKRKRLLQFVGTGTFAHSPGNGLSTSGDCKLDLAYNPGDGLGPYNLTQNDVGLWAYRGWATAPANGARTITGLGTTALSLTLGDTSSGFVARCNSTSTSVNVTMSPYQRGYYGGQRELSGSNTRLYKGSASYSPSTARSSSAVQNSALYGLYDGTSAGLPHPVGMFVLGASMSVAEIDAEVTAVNNFITAMTPA